MDDSTPHNDDRRDLFACLRDSSIDPQRRQKLRQLAIELHLALVDHCARDLSLDINQRDDVIQAGRIGLINAVDRFDPSRGVAFPAFARPTITGEMLRYLRDRGAAIRLPRRHRDITHAARASREHLRQRLGRDPRNSEYAQFLGLPATDVDAAFAAEEACAVVPLEPSSPEQHRSTPRDSCRDAYLDSLPDRLDLYRSIAMLPLSQRRVIDLHVCQGLPQSKVALRLGMSQVQVSRTLQRAIRQLREMLGS